MNILYLIPPSEGKKAGGTHPSEIVSFDFPKPKQIAKHASEKDLKCTGKRHEEARKLNRVLYSVIPANAGIYLPAIERYSGVMYTAIDYAGMQQTGKTYFDEHFLILSGMYGLLKPQDMIGNYKLPIETKGLTHFWKKKITQALNNLQADIIIDLLPGSYKKMIDWEQIHAKVLPIDFFETKNGAQKKMTHGVKKVKGEWIKDTCETGIFPKKYLRDNFFIIGKKTDKIEK